MRIFFAMEKPTKANRLSDGQEKGQRIGLIKPKDS